MPTFAQIHLEFGELTKKENYPTNDRLPPFMKTYIDGLNKPIIEKAEKEAKENKVPFDKKKLKLNTPCVLQVSHAFNATAKMQRFEDDPKISHKIPPFSFWREAPPIAGGNGNYLQGVNELANYLQAKYGGTDAVKKSDLAGRKGLLTYGGQHTEFWDGNDILQKNLMSQRFMIEAWGKRVLFWEINGLLGGRLVPDWLENWWTAFDGGKPLYYYFFSDQAVATLTFTKPKPDLLPDPIQIVNRGKVTTTINGQTVLGFTIEWQPNAKTYIAIKEGLTLRNDATSAAPMTSDWNLKSNTFALLIVKKGVF